MLVKVAKDVPGLQIQHNKKKKVFLSIYNKNQPYDFYRKKKYILPFIINITIWFLWKKQNKRKLKENNTFIAKI